MKIRTFLRAPKPLSGSVYELHDGLLKGCTATRPTVVPVRSDRPGRLPYDPEPGTAASAPFPKSHLHPRIDPPPPPPPMSVYISYHTCISAFCKPGFHFIILKSTQNAERRSHAPY